ncbi:hypothetical protein D3C80_1159750 [compost metagenome]
MKLVHMIIWMYLQENKLTCMSFSSMKEDSQLFRLQSLFFRFWPIIPNIQMTRNYLKTALCTLSNRMIKRLQFTKVSGIRWKELLRSGIIYFNLQRSHVPDKVLYILPYWNIIKHPDGQDGILFIIVPHHCTNKSLRILQLLK